MGTLYIVATPIGNKEDITLRAMRVLHDIEYIACEDTRRTGQLLRLLDDMHVAMNPALAPRQYKPVLISYFEHNEIERIPNIINLLKNDKDVALVSDAGTPAISDPGFKLIRECIKEGITVQPIPGASSVISALVVAGLPTDKFTFLGYPPRKPGHRKTFFANVLEAQKYLKTTSILFESPHKVMKTLEDMLAVFGDIDIVICRELTKKFESKRREKISETLQHYKKNPPKGEIVILFHL